MTSQWASAGAETDPLRRARDLLRSWEDLLADGELGPELPPGATAGPRPTEGRARELAEQAALRQVATLVAREPSPEQLFAVVAEQVALIFDVPHVGVVRYVPDGSVVVGGFSVGDHEPFPIGSRRALGSLGVTATVRQTGRPTRVEDHAFGTGEVAAVVRDADMRSAVASPIVVGTRLWGAIVVLSPRAEPLPENAEAGLTDFADLVATAIENAERRIGLAASEARAHELATEQAALRRVAGLLARGGRPQPVFDAVAHEVVALLGCDQSVIVRFERDGTATVMGAHDKRIGLGEHIALDRHFVVAAVRRTGKPARFDTDDPDAEGRPESARAEGVRSALAIPVIVAGELWGAITVGSLQHALPATTERRLADFTDLVATAVANAQSSERVRALAEEQAALRRVAVLVAQQPSPSEVFTAVTQVVGQLLDADLAVLHVFPGDGTATTIASWSGGGPMLPIGTRFPLVGDSLAARIFESGAPARMHSDDEAWERAATDVARSLRLRSAVGAPILVEGRLWGALMAATRGGEPWAENAETRMAAFTELVATAIASADARDALAQLAEEQAALRRVATLVAQVASPHVLFEAVADEVGRLLPIESATMGRYEPDGTVTTVASWSTAEAAFPTGRRWPTKGTNVAWMVLETGEAARLDDFSAATDPIGVAARESGIKSAVGSPIVVEGRLWGVMTATSTEGPMPTGTEARLASFTELVATAIANAESSAELAASRARIAAAADDERRRVVRDLHDGAQQRLVHTVVTLKLAQRALANGAEDGPLLVQEAIGHAERATAEVRELAHGILPAVLAHGGLRAGVNALGARMSVPVAIDVSVDRLPEKVEATAYFVVAEALTNVAKHSSAGHAEVVAGIVDGVLRVEVRDDGVGGAGPGGTGLMGLADRLAVLDGRLDVDSPPGRGTRLTAEIPLAPSRDSAGGD